MKRRNLIIVTILGLSVAMLTACGGSEEGKETITKHKTEVESSITVADNETTEDTTTESTTIVADNETTGEEVTTRVEETSKQETTTKKQETTTAKPTTTQKETTTKKQETTTVKPTTTQKETTTKQPQTTTKEEQTTKKEEETTTEVWNKTVYEEAAEQAIASNYWNNPDVIAFEDLDGDNIPELLLLNYGFPTTGDIYKYKNGEYEGYQICLDYTHEDTKLYKNTLGEIILCEVSNDSDYTEDWENYYNADIFTFYNCKTNERVGVSKVYNKDGSVFKYLRYNYVYNNTASLIITEDEYNQIYSEATCGLKFYKNVNGGAGNVRDAYKKYQTNN